MNRISYRVIGVITAGLFLQNILGCGGGDSPPSPSEEEDTALTSVSAENLANNAAAALPGCTYISDTGVMTSPAAYSMAIKIVVDEVLQFDKSASRNPPMAAARARDINETVDGTCSVPGHYTETGSHEDGVDDLLMTFDNYCLGDDEESITLVGSMSVYSVGEPSDSGPIPQNIRLSTNSGGLDIIEKGQDGTFYHDLELSNALYSFGNGDDAPTMNKPDSMTANSIVVLDGREGKEYSISNLNISVYNQDRGTESDRVIKIRSLTYTDPENGSVNISSIDDLLIDENGTMMEGTIKATGSDSAVALILMPSATLNNSFDVTLEGDGEEEQLGTMDCSAFVAGSIAEEL